MILSTPTTECVFCAWWTDWTSEKSYRLRVCPVCKCVCAFNVHVDYCGNSVLCFWQSIRPLRWTRPSSLIRRIQTPIQVNQLKPIDESSLCSSVLISLLCSLLICFSLVDVDNTKSTVNDQIKTVFQNKQGKKTIDVYWISDDGGEIRTVIITRLQSSSFGFDNPSVKSKPLSNVILALSLRFDFVSAISVDQKKTLEAMQSQSIHHWRTANHGERPQRVRLENLSSESLWQRIFEYLG